MPSNIHNTKARGEWVDDIYWRSAMELARYHELQQRLADQRIHTLDLQPVFHIKHPVTGEKVCKYLGDFRYYTPDNELVVEDVKGLRTDIYILKAKLVRVFCGVAITEVQGYPRTKNKEVIGYRWKVNGEWED
jgi:hypothetical protein